MIYKHVEWDDLRATARIGIFKYGCGAAEFHATIELNVAFENTETQYNLLAEAQQRLTGLYELKKAKTVWKRFFASDAINQRQYMRAYSGEALSVAQQPPLNGAKASVWLYFVEDAQIHSDSDNNCAIMTRPDYRHFFHTQLHERGTDIEGQTGKIFNRYSQSLARYGCSLERNCIRTWIFVQNVDTQYAGMSAARRKYFEQEGLTPQTHFIASTGIEGRYVYPDALMTMDAYSIEGISAKQVKYLKAPTHLNATHEYGVTFERGAAVDYGDRRHIVISGTASIDNRGQILHPLDVEKQAARCFENIQALLAEADARMADVAYMIVYLRDTADFAVVKRYLERHYPTIPVVMALAPVCRPGWLVEVECMAIKAIDNKMFADF